MFSGTLVSAEGAERLGILLLAAIGTNYLSGSNFYHGFRSFGSSFWAPQLLADFDFLQCLGDRLYFKLMFRTTKNLSVASRTLFPEEK